MRKLNPDRKLRLLGQYMNEYIDAWPIKIKPFDSWSDSIIDKKISVGRHREAESRKLICRYCRKQFDDYIERTKDHIVPVSRGGLDRKENRVPCCSKCNKWKSDKLLDRWLDEVRRRIKKKDVDDFYDLNTLGLMVGNIKSVIAYVKENQKKISTYRVL